jgi:4-hydroxymandelate oxidase
MPAPLDLNSLATLDDFESVAQRAFDPKVFAFIASGAADEITLRWNREAFNRIALRPKALSGLLYLDLRVDLIGRTFEHPILLAPASRLRLVHREGEAEAARGAAMANTLFAAGGFTTSSIEDIRSAAPAVPLWFQIYPQLDQGVTLDTVRRAEAQGCQAMCLTMDAPIPGVRNRPARAGFVMPANLPSPHSVRDRATLWSDLDWLRGVTKLPIVVKGILDPGDAVRAVTAGAAAIVVSNHGGRCLDTALATLDALPAMVEAADGRVPVLVDGGIRRGTDVLKALGLGARAVMIGRPYIYALGLFGAAGVKRVVDLLLTELSYAMALTGQLSVSAIDREIVVPAPR